MSSYPIITPFGEFNSIAAATRYILSNEIASFVCTYKDYHFTYDACGQIRSGKSFFRHYIWYAVKALCNDKSKPEWQFKFRYSNQESYVESKHE